MGVRRFDRSELRKPVRLDNGYLRGDTYLTRAGVFSYKRADGSEIKEYRPPEEVFAPASMTSFDLMPVTNDHPSVGLLTPENTHQFQVGTVGSPAREDMKMRGSLMVTDAKAISDLEKGKTQISLGYVCDLDFAPGVSPDGERYDAIQRNIRGNHIAIVAVGRAGPEIRVRMDTGDEEVLPSDSAQVKPLEIFPMKRKIKLDDGTTIEVDEAVAVLFDQTQAKTAASEKALVTAKADAEKASARADSAEKQIKDLNAQLAEAPAKALAAAKIRAELESKAREVLGAEEKFDGKDDDALRLAVVEKLAGEKFEGKSPAYVEARFDAEIALLGRSGLAAARVASNPVRTDSASPTAGGSLSLKDAIARYHAHVAKSK